MSAIDNNDTAKMLVQLGAKAPEVITLDSGDKVVVLPGGMGIHSLKEFSAPQRIEQEVTLLEAGSFIEYVNRFKDTDTLIFCDVSETGVTFKAMLDYHQQKEKGTHAPRYCTHVADFTAIHTPEWRAWQSANRQRMSQVDFATWLEDNAQLFVQPKGAELLELVRTLHGHANARFSTALRLDNGSHSVSYEEDVQIKGTGAGTKSGDVKLPPEVVAGVAVFQGGQPYKITARLKARVQERSLTLWFETIQMPAVVRESILMLVKQIAEKTGITPLLGRP